jgi:hypothetical protein
MLLIVRMMCDYRAGVEMEVLNSFELSCWNENHLAELRAAPGLSCCNPSLALLRIHRHLLMSISRRFTFLLPCCEVRGEGR